MRRSFLKGSLVVGISVVLTTITINAGDNINNFSNSLIAAVFPVSIPEKCSSDMVFVTSPQGGFCIDKYEASPNKECFYSDPKNQEETRFNLNKKGCVPVSVKDAVPWRNISQNQATVACAKVGKRLPSNEEWFLAALGTPDPLSGWNIENCNVDKNWKRSGLGLTGFAPRCVSFAGAYDMIGNVWEWVRNTVKNKKYDGELLPDAGYVTSVDENGIPSTTDPNTPDVNYNNDRFWVGDMPVAGMFRGGYWASGDEAGMHSVHAHITPSFVGVGIGFRCVNIIK